MTAPRTTRTRTAALFRLGLGVALALGAILLAPGWADFAPYRDGVIVGAARLVVGALIGIGVALASSQPHGGLGPMARAGLQLGVGALAVVAGNLVPMDAQVALGLQTVGVIDCIGALSAMQITSTQRPYRPRIDVVRATVLAALAIGGALAAVGTPFAASGVFLLAGLMLTFAVLLFARAALAVVTLSTALTGAIAAVAGAGLALLLVVIEPIIEEPGRARTFEQLVRIALSVASLALLAEAITRVVLDVRANRARALATTTPVPPSSRGRLAQLAIGLLLLLVGLGVTIATYGAASHTSGRYVVAYGPIVAGFGFVLSALMDGFKSFVAWRYLLVFHRKTTPRAVVGLVVGIVGFAGAMVLARGVSSIAVAASKPFVLGALGFLVVAIGWGILRPSKPSFVMYIIGLGLGLVAVTLTHLLAPSRPLSPFDPVTLQQIVLQVLNIVMIAAVAIAALATFFGLLRSVFTFFTVIPIVGVWVGTSALVMVLAVMSGFETDLRDKILGSNAHIQVTREAGEFTDWEGVKRKLDAIPGVVASTPYAVSEVVIAANNNGMNVIIKGIDPTTVGQVTNLIANLEDPDAVRRLDPLVPDESIPAPVPAAGSPPPTPAGDVMDPAPADMVDMPADPVAAPPPDAGPPPVDAATPSPPRDGGLAVLDPIDDLRDQGRYGGDARRILDIGGDDDSDIIRADDLGSSALSGRTMALHGILVGRELVKQTHLYTGEPVRIVSPLSDPSNPDATGTPIPYNREFRVAGVFYTGMYEYDLKYVYVTLDAFASFLDRGDAVDGIEVRIADADDTDRYVPNDQRAGLIQDALGAGYRVQDWRELNRSLFSALKLEKIAMFLVLGIVILVASFSIVGNLIMVVVEKAREIALLKTLGASDASITQLFAIQGLIIGLIGTALGIGTGLLGCWAGKRFGLPLNPDVYYISKLPIHVDPESVLAAAAAGILISIAATLYPALLASRVRPAAGMRH